MTIAQIMHALTPAKDAGQRVTMSQDAGEARRRRWEEDRQRFVDEQMQWL
jgi:hypothetical protein